MSLDEFANNLEKCATEMEKILVDTYTGALQLLDTKMTVRIFSEHKDSTGAKIGQYSTTPILIGAKSFRNQTQASAFFKSSEGFTDDTQGFRKLKSGKTAFLLPGGYKRLRAIQGMQSDEVTLQYTGELVRSGIAQKIGNGKFQLVFTNDLAIKKARGYEEKHGKIVFAPTQGERDTVNKYVADNIVKGMKKALNLE